MVKEDFEKFVGLMTVTAEEYGGAISAELFHVKFSMLKDCEWIEIEKAAEWILKNRQKTFPSVPTIMEFRAVIKKNRSIIAQNKAQKLLEEAASYRAQNKPVPISKLRSIRMKSMGG